MKKTAFILVFAILCISLTACGGNDASPTPEPTVAPTQVPYREGDVEIVVGDDITEDIFGMPQIPVTITNNGEYSYRVTADRISVNGIEKVKKEDGEFTLGDEVSLNVDIEPGQTVESTVTFLAATWEALGEKEIKNLEISFTINDDVGYKNYTKIVTKEY